jgi:hypothetical protein
MVSVNTFGLIRMKRADFSWKTDNEFDWTNHTFISNWNLNWKIYSMSYKLDRSLFMKAVVDGQISTDYVTQDELIKIFHDQADAAIYNTMDENMNRNDVLVFNLDWDYLNPN